MSLGWREHMKLPRSDSQLPLNSKFSENSIFSPRFQVPKRYSRLFLALVAALGIVYFFDISLLPRRNNPHPYPRVLRTAPYRSGLPPLFNSYVEYENHLPEQLDDNFAEAKYIFMANHAAGCGWGNVLQEMIHSSLVASGSGRGFVWYNYTWSADAPEYSDFNGKIIPARVPISTMLSGYILGLDSGSRKSDAPRSIPRTLYERICPPEERVYIDKASVEAYRQLNPENAGTSLDDISGKAVLKAWIDRLNQPDIKDARCVEVKQGTSQIFDIWVLGTKRVHDLWDTIANSPIMTGWSWSPLIYHAFERNRKVIFPQSFFSLAAPEETKSLPLLTLHLRRGDYADHCVNLAAWGSTYTGQSSFPELEERDRFVIPKVIEGHSSSDSDPINPGDPPIVSSEEEKKRYYAKHCYPDIGQVVARVREVVHDYESLARNKTLDGQWGSQKYENWGSRTMHQRRDTGRESVGNKLLKRIYIMTNGDRELLQELKRALMDDAKRSRNTAEMNGWDFE